MHNRRTIWHLAALAMTGVFPQATAKGIPLSRPAPDCQPGNSSKPVKANMLAGEIDWPTFMRQHHMIFDKLP